MLAACKTLASRVVGDERSASRCGRCAAVCQCVSGCHLSPRTRREAPRATRSVTAVKLANEQLSACAQKQQRCSRSAREQNGRLRFCTTVNKPDAGVLVCGGGAHIPRARRRRPRPRPRDRPPVAAAAADGACKQARAPSGRASPAAVTKRVTRRVGVAAHRPDRGFRRRVAAEKPRMKSVATTTTGPCIGVVSEALRRTQKTTRHRERRPYIEMSVGRRSRI